jgi:hypothetical protein
LQVSKAETYKIYIYKVLKQVHPDTGACGVARVCWGRQVACTTRARACLCM